MQNESRYHNDVEIDLHQYIEVLKKRKKAFFAVFLLVVISGFAYLQFSPKIYKVSMLIQPPVSGEALSGANDIESAETLRGLIVSQAFNEELIKRLDLKLSTNDLNFSVYVPPKTNVLDVSINLEANKKEFGIALLKGLSDVIIDSYAKRIDADNFEVANQIKQNERAIAAAKEKEKNLKDQIKEIFVREERLGEEIKAANASTAQMIGRREELLKDSSSADSVSTLLLTNFLQNNLNFLNQMNNQMSDLSIRRANLALEMKDLEFKISELQVNIDKLNRSKKFISNVRIASKPAPSASPVSPDKKKILGLSILMGFVLGVTAAFVQEFWHK